MKIYFKKNLILSNKNIRYVYTFYRKHFDVFYVYRKTYLIFFLILFLIYLFLNSILLNQLRNSIVNLELKENVFQYPKGFNFDEFSKTNTFNDQLESILIFEDLFGDYLVDRSDLLYSDSNSFISSLAYFLKEDNINSLLNLFVSRFFKDSYTRTMFSSYFFSKSKDLELARIGLYNFQRLIHLYNYNYNLHSEKIIKNRFIKGITILKEFNSSFFDSFYLDSSDYNLIKQIFFKVNVPYLRSETDDYNYTLLRNLSSFLKIYVDEIYLCSDFLKSKTFKNNLNLSPGLYISSLNNKPFYKSREEGDLNILIDSSLNIDLFNIPNNYKNRTEGSILLFRKFYENQRIKVKKIFKSNNFITTDENIDFITFFITWRLFSHINDSLILNCYSFSQIIDRSIIIEDDAILQILKYVIQNISLDLYAINNLNSTFKNSSFKIKGDLLDSFISSWIFSGKKYGVNFFNVILDFSSKIKAIRKLPAVNLKFSTNSYNNNFFEKYSIPKSDDNVKTIFISSLSKYKFIKYFKDLKRKDSSLGISFLNPQKISRYRTIKNSVNIYILIKSVLLTLLIFFILLKTIFDAINYASKVKEIYIYYLYYPVPYDRMVVLLFVSQILFIMTYSFIIYNIFYFIELGSLPFIDTNFRFVKHIFSNNFNDILYFRKEIALLLKSIISQIITYSVSISVFYLYFNYRFKNSELVYYIPLFSIVLSILWCSCVLVCEQYISWNFSLRRKSFLSYFEVTSFINNFVQYTPYKKITTILNLVLKMFPIKYSKYYDVPFLDSYKINNLMFLNILTLNNKLNNQINSNFIFNKLYFLIYLIYSILIGLMYTNNLRKIKHIGLVEVSV